ncbi:MAG: hypothetical protein WEB00_03020 [Dehalococcoidia bacterium]
MDVFDVSLRLFAAWLNDREGREAGPHEQAGDLYRVPSPAGDLAVMVEPLFETGGDEWRGKKASVEEQLGASLENGSYALWVPPGADLPLDEPGRSEFIFRVKMAAARLQAGKRVDLKVPVTLGVRKQDDEGSYVSALGGLQPVWSWFTGQVSGVYTVDARSLTRLPEDKAEREQIVAAITESIAGMKKDDRLEVAAEDSWTLQRLAGAAGFAIVAQPSAAPGPEHEVRKRVRRLLATAAEKLTGVEGQKALVLPALYLYAAEENVSTAVRGFDPALYAALDYIVLVTDGAVKPIIAPPAPAR